MEVINVDALIAQGKVVTVNEVDLDNDYFVIAKYDPRFRNRTYKATDYPVYAIKADDVMNAIIPPTPPVPTSLTPVILKFTLDLNSTTDQPLVLPAGNYIFQNAYLTNASLAPVTAAELTINTNMLRVGNKLFTSNDSSDWLNLLFIPSNFGPLVVPSCGAPPCNMHVVTSGTLYAKLTTAEGSVSTVDLYLVGIKL